MFSFLKNIFNTERKSDDISVQADAVFVDVRSKGEFASGHLQGAKNIPLELIQSSADMIKGFPQAILYCRSGNRSSHAVQVLKSMGLTNVIDGGSVFSAQDLVNKSGHFHTIIVKESQNVPVSKDSLAKDVKSLKVLIPTDFSQQAEYSYLMAQKLEEHLTLDLHFLHVMDLPESVEIDADGEIVTCGEIDITYVKEQKQIAEQKLNNVHKNYGNKVKTHLKLGKITDKIKEFAESENFDLIVMATQGSWGIKEKVRKTHAEIVSHKTLIPLLTLMCDRSDLIIHHILFANDFTRETHIKLSLAEKFSKYFGAEYTLLHLAPQGNEIDKAQVFERMDDFAKNQGITTYDKKIVQAQDVESGINEFLKSKDADVLFIGTHDYSGFVNKAASEAVIRHVFKPIITVHL